MNYESCLALIAALSNAESSLHESKKEALSMLAKCSEFASKPLEERVRYFKRICGTVAACLYYRDQHQGAIHQTLGDIKQYVDSL